MEKAPPTSQEPPADRPPRASRRPRDLVISLAVLLVPLLLLVWGYQLVSGRNQPVEVDPAPALAEAQAAGLPVATPTGLADGWAPVSAVLQRPAGGLTLRIGYLTPDGPSVQLLQSNLPAERLLPAELPDGAQPMGTVDLAGEPWQAYENPDGDRALVRLAPDLTTLVVGAASATELQDLAASLAR